MKREEKKKVDWYEMMQKNKMVADVVMDRLAGSTYHFVLKGDSLRKICNFAISYVCTGLHCSEMVAYDTPKFAMMYASRTSTRRR